MTPRRVMFVLLAYLAAIWLVFGVAVACRAETVTIDEAAFIADRFEVTYRVNDGPQLFAAGPASGEVHLQLPQTSVEIIRAYEWVFDEWEWIVQAEPTVHIIWK